MIIAENEARSGARVLHDVADLMKQPAGSLWRESALDASKVGRDGANPPYVIATASGREESAYVAVCVDDGSGYTTAEEHGIFLPYEHQLTYPLVEVTDGTRIVFANEAR